MKVAFECRTDLLEAVQPFADFDFLLVHKVLEDEAYLKYYKEFKRLNILDNSVNEKGCPCTIEEIKTADEALGGATHIVAPDWLGDVDKTLNSYIDCLKAFPERSIIPVVQGKDLEEAFDCALSYVRHATSLQRAPLLSIPYDIGSIKKLSPRIMGERRALLISSIPKEAGIHLLGFTGLEELYWYSGRANVLSIDTGAPILLGLQGKDILDPLESKETPTLNQMDELELDTKAWAGICRNIAIFRKYTQ